MSSLNYAISVSTDILIDSNGNNFKLSVYECFLLSSALSSKDSFTASLMIDHHMLGDLHSIVFGEGLVNDSTALTLFSAL